MDRAVKNATVRLYDRDEIEQIRRELYQLELQYRVADSLDHIIAKAKQRVPS